MVMSGFTFGAKKYILKIDKYHIFYYYCIPL